MFNFFKKKDHLPRIAWRETRAGKREYCIEQWKFREYGALYIRTTEWFRTQEEAQNNLKVLTDQEYIKFGYITQEA